MIEVILFDLGGVVIELGKEPLPNEWLEKGKEFTLKDWFKSETAQRFEKGEISAQVFAGNLKQELNLKVSPEEIIESFTQWPVGMFSKMPQLLEALKVHYKLAVLSNTNELHYPRFAEFGLDQYFDHIYASHLMHLAKPDTAAYQYVLDDLGMEASSVLFIDDNFDNVQAAGKLGIDSIYANGEQAVYEVFEAFGFDLQ